jgi:hypothetical protein
LPSEHAFFLLQQLFEALLGDEVQRFLDFPPRLDPLADGVLQGVRDIDHATLSPAANGEIQGDMLFALLAVAARLAAGARHFDEAATEQGLLGHAFDGAGSGIPFFGGSLGTSWHWDRAP